MIHDAATFGREVTLRADVCVVGSGAGGAMVAWHASRSGARVVVLEAGGFMAPEYMSQLEHEMIPQLLWDNGGRTTTDRAVRIHQGKGVGGSTLHNLNLCARIPAPIREQWRRERGLEELSEERWGQLYHEVETRLGVSRVPREEVNRHNLLFEAGCAALGWAHGGLRHNRSGCIGSGFCELGCAYDAKNNAAKMLVPPAVEAGARFVTRCQAVRLRVRAGRVEAVEAVALDPVSARPTTRVTVEAARTVLAASATATPALLLRSGLRGPEGSVGETLRVHPALVAAGLFAEPVEAWKGIPQTVECTEFLDFEAAHAGELEAAPLGTRTWLVPAFAHPVGTATILPGHGALHRELMERYAYTAAVTNMVHDATAGRVRPRGPLGLSIDYWPSEADRRELLFGLARSVELLFAAGAERVVIPGRRPTVLAGPGEISGLASGDLSRGSLDVTAVHPMGSVPMGGAPSVSATDAFGRFRHVEGLWVADGSLCASSIGVPPQVSIYALGLHVAESVVG